MTPRTTLSVLLSSLLLAACGGSDAALEGCTPADLRTKQPGLLTLSTGAVTRAPWVTGPRQQGRSADPRNGQGYDAAVGFALARRLGFEPGEVRWVATPFADALAAGSKPFDVNINQVTVRPDRATKVDFAEPYYRVRHAVVGLAGGKAREADSVDGLGDLRIGYVAGSSSEAAAKQVLGAAALTGYADDDELRRALTGGGLDAVVTTYLTALRWDADETQLVGGELVGVLADAPPADERFGLVLEKGSPLTGCVDRALDALRSDGTLQRLERTWLVEDSDGAWFD